MKLRLDERYLIEDAVDTAAAQVDAEEVVLVEEETRIEKALNRSLSRAKGKKKDFPNILLVGDAGFGKTQIVHEWAKKNNINLVYKDAKTMNATDLGGMIARDADNPRRTQRLGSNEFSKSLSKPNSVLFLDEFNRAKDEIRGALLTLVADHVVWNPDVDGEMEFLPNFLFTIAAINPPNAAYPGAKNMDPAERSRFRRIPIQPDPQEHLRYLTTYYSDLIKEAEASGDSVDKLENERRLALAKTLLNSPDFYYDTEEEVEDGVDDSAYVPLNYRSLKIALDESDGTKADFLDIWSDFCNYNKKQLISDILKEYVDVQDKANDILNKHQTKSSVFVTKDSMRDKLRKLAPNIKV